MMKKILLFVFVFIALGFPVLAQVFTLSGTVNDKRDNKPIVGVSITVSKTDDKGIKTGTVTDLNGNYIITGLKNGSYLVELEYVGYKKLGRNITISNESIAMGVLKLETEAKQLKEVTVAGKQIRAEQKGDTSQFRADAYKTNPDATTEDLVTKMPGVTSDNTGLKVNGETVQQILVDGKPFFGNDPAVALKNMPAEVIDKIQIFDRLSDQAGFTGFDDGNAQKTMNIITKRNKSEGLFGKIYAGYGTDERYMAGGNLNFFNGNRRVSVLGLSNNINQQNFSAEDILGATGGSQGGGRGGRRGGGGNSSNNFMVGQQGGIAATNALGLNYSNNWGKKIKVSASYFFNNTENTNNSGISRNYFNNPDSVVLYTENNTAQTLNNNHRFNARFEYTIDSSNSITFTPSLSLQENNSSTTGFANNSAGDVLQSLTNNKTSAYNNGYNSSGNLLYQHKFKKARRTISLNLSGSLNEKIGNGTNYSTNEFYKVDTLIDRRDQRYDLYTSNNILSANLSYTEPIGKTGQLMLSYNPSISNNMSDKDTRSLNTVTNEYSEKDTLFSSNYNNSYNTQRAGISYRINNKKSNFNIGSNVQQATLNGAQQFPRNFNTSRSFNNILPNAFYNHKYEDGRNLRIMYRTSTDVPSVSQLQNVIDISNPILLRTGNVSLNQTFEQRLIVRYGLTKSQSGRNFFLNMFVSNTNDYIANATYIPTRDSVFSDPVTNTSILINRGSQVSQPVNLDGYWNTRLFATYGIPVSMIKSNINFIGGLNYVRTPGIINKLLNYSDNYIPSLGMVLSSNVSENIDFTLTYTGFYNVVKNSIQSSAKNNFYNHNASFRINWIFLDNFVLNTNITNNFYTAFSGTGSQNYYLWGAFLGYKFMKKTMEARLSVYDLLNQNTSISRSVTETYIENTNTQVLKQYFIFQLTYNIRKFKGAAPPEAEKTDNNYMQIPGVPNYRK
jgi:hypothetical protein